MMRTTVEIVLPPSPIRSIYPRVHDQDDVTPTSARPVRRPLRSRIRPNIVRLIPGVTRLPLAYSPR